MPTSTIEEQRIADLNDHPLEESKRYVLYWMQQDGRTRLNHALEFAIQRANALSKPLVVGFGLMDDYPEANLRHYLFLLQGLRDVSEGLAARGIKFVLRYGHPAEVAIELATGRGGGGDGSGRAAAPAGVAGSRRGRGGGAGHAGRDQPDRPGRDRQRQGGTCRPHAPPEAA